MAENPTRVSTRRDTLKLGGAMSVALAAGSVLANGTVAQDATPAAGNVSMITTTITLDAAVRLIEAAEQKATAIGVPMAIAVVDAIGVLKAFHRMDGLDRIVSVDLVQRKAYTSASFRAPTHALAEGSAENLAFALSLVNVPNFTLIGGGYPIMDGEVVVGGIGVGGGSEEQDMEVAEAALAAVLG